MRTISDAELVLFHHRDGLDAARLAQIDAALRGDAALSRRYAQLTALLDAAVEEPLPEPPAGFAARMQAHVAALTASPGVADGGFVAPPVALHAHRGTRRRLLRRLSAAAAAVLLLAVGFQIGQRSAPSEPAPLAAAPTLDSARIYNALLAAHLDGTRQALLTAVNDAPGEFGEGNARLAEALIESNRLYLAAAEAHGDRRLAGLLRALEPVLIELANPADGADIQLRKGVSDYVERSDLLFQVRAAEAGLRARTVTRT